MGNTIFCALLLLMFGFSAAVQPTKPAQRTANSKAAIDSSSKTEVPIANDNCRTHQFLFNVQNNLTITTFKNLK